MILYFIDGRVDCFELAKEYPELENAFIIDAVDGISECYRQLNEIECDNLNNHQYEYSFPDDYVSDEEWENIVRRFLNILWFQMNYYS